MFRLRTFAESTKQSYRTHRDTYLRFCIFIDISPIPASSHTICQYAAFLAGSLKFSSINNYLNIIALLHKDFGLSNPLTNNWALKSLLTGVKRAKGSTVTRSYRLTSIFYRVFSILLIFITVLTLLSRPFA